MRKCALILTVICLLGRVYSQQTIAEINWTDTPRMESKAVPNQTNASLNVTANIPNANIYLNNDYIGKTPFLTRNLAPGIYKLRLNRSGYYDREFYLTLNMGTANSVYIELSPVTGFLTLSVEPPQALVYIDGKHESASFLELPEGSYNVEVKAFGYETWHSQVSIVRRQSKELQIKLNLAEFSVSQLQLSTKRFNPQNPANLGKLKMEFSVTATGNGNIVIFDSAQNPVADIPLKSFKTWKQTAEWNGKTAYGQPAPDGAYTVLLTAQGDNSAQQQDLPLFTRENTVEIDSQITYPIQPLTFLGGSFGKNPSPLMYPQGTIYASINTTPYFDISGKGFIAAPVNVQLLFAPFSWLETTVNAQIFADGTSPLPVSGGLTIKAGGKKRSFLYAGFLRYGIANREKENLFSNSGLGVGVLMACTLGPVTLSTHAEYVIGPERGYFVPFSQIWNAGLSIHVQKSIFSGTLWSKWISTQTILSGIDGSVLIPGTNILFNAEYAIACPLGKTPVMSVTAGLSVLF